MKKLLVLAVVMSAQWCTVRSQITVASAADMQYALTDMAAAFKSQTGKEIKTIFGSSGKLTTQIKTGAPFDVFIAANMAYPDSLFQWGYAVERPRLCAYGVLVLWNTKNLDLTNGLGILSSDAVKKIALPDPNHAPYGQAAVQAMSRLGMMATLKSRFIFAENVSQAAQYIGSGAVDIGFNAKSMVISPQMKDKGAWVEVNDSLYTPISQGVIITKYGNDNNPETSRVFYDFLFSKKAREILLRYGFLIPASSSQRGK